MARRWAIALALCAGCEVTYAPGVGCAVGEGVSTVHAAPPHVHDLLVVVDTHGAEPERESIAAAFERALVALGTGDVDADGIPEFRAIEEDLHVVVSAAGCGEVTEHRWVEWLAISDPATLARAVGDAIRALPACDRSVPLAAAVAAAPALRPADTIVDVVLVTDEDEVTGASAAPLLDAIGDEVFSAGALLVAGCPPSEPPRALAAAVAAIGGDVLPACGDLARALVYALTPRVASSFGGWCMPRVQPTTDDALAPCELLEELGPRGRHHRCGELPGRAPTPAAITGDGREVCRVIQRAPSDPAPGFRLDRAPTECGELGTHVAIVGTTLEPDAVATLRCTTLGPAGECAP